VDCTSTCESDVRLHELWNISAETHSRQLTSAFVMCCRTPILSTLFQCVYRPTASLLFPMPCRHPHILVWIFLFHYFCILFMLFSICLGTLCECQTSSDAKKIFTASPLDNCITPLGWPRIMWLKTIPEI